MSVAVLLMDAFPPEERPLALAGDSAQLDWPAASALEAQVAAAGLPLSSGTDIVKLYGTTLVKLAGAVVVLVIAPFADSALTLKPVLQFTVAEAATLPLPVRFGVVNGAPAAMLQLVPIVPDALMVSTSAKAGCAALAAVSTGKSQQ